MRRIGLWVFLLSALALPARAEQRQFGDWFATCDNLRNCVIIGVREFAGDDSSQGYVRIAREAARAAPTLISLTVDEVADTTPSTPWVLQVDHAGVPGLLAPANRRTATDTGSEESHDRRAALGAAQSAVLLAAIRRGRE